MRTTEVVINRCTFNEEVRLTSLEKSPTIIFVACNFKKGLCAREAKIGKSLKFINCDFGKAGNDGTDIALNFEGAHVGGELLFYNCRIGGRVFASGLLAERDVRLRGCQVAVDHGAIGKCLRFDEIGTADILSLLQKEGWTFKRSFGPMPAISLESAEIKGDLEITAAPVETTPSATVMQAFLVGDDPRASSASVITGNINAEGLSVHGRISLFGTVCVGSVNLDSCRCDQVMTLVCNVARTTPSIHFRTLGAFELNNASLNADLDFRLSKIGTHLMMRGAQIRGSLFLTNTEIHDMASLYRTSIKGNVDVLGLKVGRNMECTFATMAGLWAYQRLESAFKLNSDSSLEVKGDLNLSGAQIENVHLRGILVRGIVNIVTGKFGTIVLAHGLQPVADDVGKFGIVPSRVGAVRMSAIQVTETMSVSGLQVLLPDGWFWENHVKDRHDHGFTLEQSTIGRDLLFFVTSPEWSLEQRIDWPDLKKRLRSAGNPFGTQRKWNKFPWAETNDALCHASIWGGLNLQANQIGGKLDLRGVTVKGPISLNDTSIGLDLQMDGFLEERKDGDPHYEFLETTCLHLNAEKLNCGGDINFTGLRVLRDMNLAANEIPNLDARKRGVLLAHGAHVTGQIIFLPKEQTKRARHLMELAAKRRDLNERKRLLADLKVQHEQTPKNKSLKDSVRRAEKELNELSCDVEELNGGLARKEHEQQEEVVAGYALIDGISEDPPTLDLTGVDANHLLLTGSNVPHKSAKVSLERAHFGRLEIVNPPPGPIDLSRTKVDRWVVGDSEDPNAMDYEAVLKPMQPFDRSTWVAVETSLRNQAQDGDANRIYREMRWKARRTRLGIERFGKYTGAVLLVISLFVLGLMCVRGASPVLVIGGAISLGASLLTVDKDGLYGILGFGTFAWVPIIVAVLLFPLTVFVFAHPQNVRASSDLLQVLGNNGEPLISQAQTITPHSNPTLEIRAADIERFKTDFNWTWPDALALTLRYQIPIMPSLTHTWWEASENRIPFLFGITAQHYALGLTIYHWIAWPLFLVWITARVVRGRQT